MMALPWLGWRRGNGAGEQRALDRAPNSPAPLFPPSNAADKLLLPTPRRLAPRPARHGRMIQPRSASIRLRSL
jgi:hypothetical protein